MSYVRSTEVHRGPGAIAAVDAVNPKRRALRQRMARVSAVRDRRLAQIATRPASLGLTPNTSWVRARATLIPEGPGVNPVLPPPRPPGLPAYPHPVLPPSPVPPFTGGTSAGVRRIMAGATASIYGGGAPAPSSGGGRYGTGTSGGGKTIGGGGGGGASSSGGGASGGSTDPTVGAGGSGGGVPIDPGGGGGGGGGGGSPYDPTAGGGGGSLISDPIPPPDLLPDDGLVSSSTRPWLIAGGVAIAGYFLFLRKKR